MGTTKFSRLVKHIPLNGMHFLKQITSSSRSDDTTQSSNGLGNRSDDGTSSSFRSRSNDDPSSNMFIPDLSSPMKIYEIFPDYSRKSIDVMHNLTSKNTKQTVNTSLDTTPAKILYLMNNQN